MYGNSSIDIRSQNEGTFSAHWHLSGAMTIQDFASFLVQEMLNLQASDLETLKVTKATPPRLVIVGNADGTKAGCAIISEARIIHVSDNLTDALLDLLFCYYAWDLSYPKTYQLLGFIQQFVLEDNKNKFFASSSYIKFVKAME